MDRLQKFIEQQHAIGCRLRRLSTRRRRGNAAKILLREWAALDEQIKFLCKLDLAAQRFSLDMENQLATLNDASLRKL